MTTDELKLAAHLLKLASEHYANHGCNDFDLTPFYPTEESRIALDKEYHEWNGDSEEHDPQYAKSEYGDDWILMGMMASKLEALAEATDDRR